MVVALGGIVMEDKSIDGPVSLIPHEIRSAGTATARDANPFRIF